MYLSSHFSTPLNVFFFSIEKRETRKNDDYLFLLMQNGTITVSQDDRQYILSRGDIFLLEPGYTYEWNLYSKNFCLGVQVGNDFIRRLLPAGSVLTCNSAIGKKSDYQELADALTEIAVAFSQENNENRLFSLLFHLLDVLQARHIQEVKPAATDLASQRVNEIREYILQNYHLPLSLQELADQMYLSPQYLSKFIKQHMGVTFIQYLNNVRMEHAYEELMHTNHSVTEIAFNNGFSNTAAFNKSFREIYGESPSAHRVGKQPDTTAGLPPYPKSDWQEEKHEAAENYKIPVDSTTSCYPNWSDTVNIGALTNALSIHFHESFTEAQRAIHFRYVRFDDIFSEEIMRPLENKKGFDYTNLNMVLDFFKEIDVLPFIELSYKPHKNNLIDFRKMNYEESFRAEKKLSYYQYALNDLLRHCINRYGYTYVSRWRFEVWQKHDETLHYHASAKQYVEKFRFFREIIKNLLPTCPVGGPGFNTSAAKSSFKEILKEMNRQQIYPDFYSIYVYCFEPEKYDSPETFAAPHALLSATREPMLQRFCEYEEIIREMIPGNAPIYITEFNSGIFGTNYTAGSAFQAAFICKNSLDLLAKTSCVAYWHFSDEVRQFSSIPQRYSTDNGLADCHGIPKASLFAYVLLSKLKHRMAARGENYIVTTNGSTSYQLLAFNYAHYSPYFSMNYLSPLRIEHTYDAFEAGQTRIIQFTLCSLPTGRYKIFKHTLNRKHGSLLDECIRIYETGNLTPDELDYMMLNMQEEEIEYYKSHIRPLQEIFYTETDVSGSLSLSFTMEPHEIVLYEFSRIL